LLAVDTCGDDKADAMSTPLQLRLNAQTKEIFVIPVIQPPQRRKPEACP
jgi:hypothetical protein